MVKLGREDSKYRQAKREGYLARSVYKLKELNERYRLLKPGLNVLDLGCHPGSWLQYTAQIIKNNGFITGVDIQALEFSLPANVNFIQKDLFEVTEKELVLVSEKPYDLVLCDVAPRTTGIVHADNVKSALLTSRALELACRLLKPGGNFVSKIFWSGDAQDILAGMKKVFDKAKAHKPDASQAGSREIFLVGLGLK